MLSSIKDGWYVTRVKKTRIWSWASVSVLYVLWGFILEKQVNTFMSFDQMSRKKCGGVTLDYAERMDDIANKHAAKSVHIGIVSYLKREGGKGI